MSAPRCHPNMAPDFLMALILLWAPRLSLIRSNTSLNYPIHNTSELFSAGSCRPFSLPLVTVLPLVLPAENPTLPTIHMHLPFLQVQLHPSLINPPSHSDSASKLLQNWLGTESLDAQWSMGLSFNLLAWFWSLEVNMGRRTLRSPLSLLYQSSVWHSWAVVQRAGVIDVSDEIVSYA